MPVMDGLTATRLIRQDGASRTSRIIAVTAHSMPEDLDRIRAAGMDDVLSKPISGANLIRVLSGGLEAEGLIDDTRLAELRTAVGAEGLSRLAEKFFHDGNGLVGRLLAEDANITTLCHEAAGLASVLGATRLRVFCSRAEEMSKQRPDDARRLLRRDLQGLWAETASALRAQMGGTA